MLLKFLYAFFIAFIFSAATFAQTGELKGRWFLNELTSDGTPIKLFVKNPFPKKISINFADKESFGLASSCNSMGGKYTLEAGGKFKAGQIFSTKMFCEGAMEIENALSNAIGKATRYDIKNGILTLRDAGGMNVLQFSRSETAGNQPDSKEITLYVASKQVRCMTVAPMKCFRVRENIRNNWRLFYENIEGFDFERGYYYILKVRRTRIPNPPKDTSSFSYELIEVVKKTKKFVKE